MKKTAFIVVFALLAVAFGVAIKSAQWKSYHDFEGRCLECHITIPEPGEQPRTFTKDITRMCADCHKDEQELSHPVDVKPVSEVPQSLPLDWKGDVTCVTCHPVHQDGYGVHHMRTKTSGQGFCMMCHDDLEGQLHKLSVGSAHMGRSETEKASFEAIAGLLDEMSRRCLACHDALTAGDSLVENIELRRSLFHNANTIGVSHPIGVSYIRARRLYKAAYTPVNMLPKEIKLFNGTVGCGSCHNPYSKKHFELVMSNEKSALCLACHVK